MNRIVFACSLLLVVTFAWGCSSFFNEEPDYEKIADNITHNTALKLRKEKDLIPIGSGGRMMDDIKKMMLAFHYYKQVDIPTARRLLVYCVDEYLSDINTNEEVRPYLHNYPFTTKNIEIELYFYKEDRRDVPLGQILAAVANEGRVSFYIHNKEGRLTTIHEETYEEAVRAIIFYK